MNSKLISEFMSLGLGTISQKEAVVALQVYTELCEVKRYWDVQYFYDSVLNVLYFMAKKTKSAIHPSVFVPVSSTTNLSFNIISKYLTLAKEESTDFYIVIVDTDSTCVYYQCKSGLATVNPPGKRETVESKREKLDVELRKLKDVIEHSALCGIEVTLPSTSTQHSEVHDKEETDSDS